ncbi:MAG: lipoprotein-releasing system ATP-binding protein LolD [Treponema sp.]|nr:MAG: lipoprotein-releasing system ATP-binding protein LolD [Treponema sp.]
MNNTVLEISNLKKSFASTNENLLILNDLSLNINSGNTVSVTGSSGSGKSTLLNIIGGLEKSDFGIIKAGNYRVDLLDENELTEYRRSFLGLIFQFHYLLKDFTALENVMLPALISGMKKKEAKEKAESLLDEVKLNNRLSHYPTQLSGGERQRTAVARALINEPSLILADEPTGNLDPANSNTVRKLLFSVVEKHKKTLIVVTHDTNIASMTNISYNLQNGKLIQI